MQTEKIIEIQCYSQKTKKAYLNYIRYFLKFCEGKPLQEKIEDFLYYLKTKRNYEPSSLNTAKYALIYFFKNTLKQNIYIHLYKIKRKEQLPKDMAMEDIGKIINVIYNIKHKALVETTYGSGLRSSEAIKIQWIDLNFNEKIIRIDNGKGGRDRIVRLSDKAIEHLKEWQKAQKPESRYVFNSGKEDKPLTMRSFQQILIRASERAGLKINVFPHRLRHSFGTHLAKQGVNLRYIQKALGHKSIRTTERYINITDEDIKNLRSPLDAPIVQYNEH